MIIIFKSNQKMFDKERCGDKPNTLRKIDEKDERFKKLRNWGVNIVRARPSHICIENKETGSHFVREITDVTEHEGWMIISWDAKGGLDE